MKRFIAYLATLILLFFVISEAILRITHLAPEFPERMLDDKYSVYKFQPNQTGIYTNGRLGEWKSNWTINNEGWNSELTYTLGTRITGIIGDSYIQTIYFNPSDHIYNVFKEHAPDRTFYSFGIQGASFSQYLNILKYASDKYEMDSVLIFLDNNDIEESIASLVRMPRNMQLKLKEDSVIEAPPKYHENFVRNTLKDIALFRYMLMNFSFELKLGVAKKNLKKNIADAESIEKMKHRAVEYIVSQMVSCNVKHITFVLDGDRKSIYKKNGVNHSKFYTYFKDIPKDEKFIIIDLHEFLLNDYAKHHETFEIGENNNHWNLKTVHKIAAYVSEKAGLN